MQTMKAVRFAEFGAPDVLKLEDVPVPEPRDDDVLVRVNAAGVNPIDWKVREGRLHQLIHHTLPLIPGCDFAGVVEKLGAAISEWKIGDEVFGKSDLSRDGAYAEFLAVRGTEVARKPRGIDDVSAAAVPSSALTAWQALFGRPGAVSIDLKAGQSLLILGAAGGVGSFAVQFAKARKARVLTTARAANAKYLKELGADVVIDYEKETYDETLRGIDAVLDLIGGETEERSCAVLRPGGVLASTVHPVPEDLVRRYDIRAVTVGARMMRAQLEEIGRLIDEKIVRVPVTEVLPLSEARRAHEISESHHAHGKIVLRIR